MAELDADVRRFDEDRWLASRFAPADVRTRLIAVYALNNEIARTADVVSQPAIGDIRLAWWREALNEIAAGKPPRSHPVLEAFEDAARAAPSMHAPWERLIEARGKDLEGSPFAAWSDLEGYLDATAGGVMRAAIAACGGDEGEHEQLVRSSAQAWGCVGLLRAEPHWRAKSRTLLPRGGTLEDLSARAQAAIADVRASGRVPAAVFPAVGYAALAGDYLRARARGQDGVLLLTRQLKLIVASATGRL